MLRYGAIDDEQYWGDKRPSPGTSLPAEPAEPMWGATGPSKDFGSRAIGAISGAANKAVYGNYNAPRSGVGVGAPVRGVEPPRSGVGVGYPDRNDPESNYTPTSAPLQTSPMYGGDSIGSKERPAWSPAQYNATLQGLAIQRDAAKDPAQRQAIVNSMIGLRKEMSMAGARQNQPGSAMFAPEDDVGNLQKREIGLKLRTLDELGRQAKQGVDVGDRRAQVENDLLYTQSPDWVRDYQARSGERAKAIGLRDRQNDALGRQAYKMQTAREQAMEDAKADSALGRRVKEAQVQEVENHAETIKTEGYQAKAAQALAKAQAENADGVAKAKVRGDTEKELWSAMGTTRKDWNDAMGRAYSKIRGVTGGIFRGEDTVTGEGFTGDAPVKYLEEAENNVVAPILEHYRVDKKTGQELARAALQAMPHPDKNGNYFSKGYLSPNIYNSFGKVSRDEFAKGLAEHRAKLQRIADGDY